MINIALIEFSRRVIMGGRISLKGIFMLPFYYVQMILALPFACVQNLIFRHRIKKTFVAKDPVFILGHYRCGTTYLQKLMMSDRQFGCLTNYDALFPNSNLLFGLGMQAIFQRLINMFKIKNPFFHDSILKLTDPAEEDDYLMNKASSYTAYWGLIFPLRWREWLNGSTQFADQKYLTGWKKEYLNILKYASFRNNGKRLVLKSPPNTARVKVLLEMYPEAKFIYIYRNPFQLYYSIRNMWNRAILKYYSVQNISAEELDEIIFEHFIYIEEQYIKESKLIPEGNLIEISYEELKADSFNAMRKIYSKIALPGFELTTADLLTKLKTEQEYQNFQHQFSDATFKKVEERWGRYIRLWNY